MRALLLCTILTAAAFTVPSARAENQENDKAEEAAFLPAWKLLGQTEKQQFISGYSHGWKDAVKIIDIVIAYVQENPERAARALQSIKEIYTMSGVRPDQLVHEIDLFYSDASNRDAPLSKAITAAKARAR